MEGTNNKIYGEAGDDQIYVYTQAGGNEFYGGAGEDLFGLIPLDSVENIIGADIIHDYEFGTDTIEVSDSSYITDSEISGSDILLSFYNGGTVRVIGAAENGLSIRDSSTGNMLNF